MRRWLRLPRAPSLYPVVVSLAVAAVFLSPVPAEFQQAIDSAANGLRIALPAFANVVEAVDLGPMAPTTLTAGVALMMPDQPALDSYIQEEYTPGTPLYHHLLDPASFQAHFAPSAAEVNAIESYYAGYGLKATATPDRLMVSLAGSSTDLASAFRTSFHNYQLADGTQVYANAGPAFVPNDLAISAVTGLTDYGAPQPLYHGPAVPVLPSTPGHPAACSSLGGITPRDLQHQYGLNSLIYGGNGGQGITVGIVDAYDASATQPTLKADLINFASNCGLPAPKENFLYAEPQGNPNLNSTSTGWAGETELDQEMVDSVAPDATIDLTFASDSSLAVYEAVDYLVAYNLTQAISMSWGESDVGNMQAPPQGPCLPYYSCNSSWDGSYGFLHPVFAEAVAEGITPVSAAGDQGAADGTYTVSTDYPSSDQYVLGVGGTVMNNSNSLTYAGESAWSGNCTGCTGNFGGSGGGYAPWPQPWWQQGPGNQLGKGLRGDPDVGADSADGTSEATPTWAGMIGLADQLHGGGLGLVQVSLYAVSRTAMYKSAFHDIVNGNNGYSAGYGWSPITGLGSPNGSVLFPLLAGYDQPQSSLAASLGVSPASGSAPLTTTLTATASGGVSPYEYDFVPGLYLGQWTNHASTLSYTYTTSGAYFAQVEVWDADGNWTQSLPVAVNVGGTALSPSLAESASVVLVGTTVTYTTTLTGGTSPYFYTYLFGDGSYGYNASATEPHTYHNPGTFCPSVEVLDSHTPSDGGSANAPCITVILPGQPLTAAIVPSTTSGQIPLTVNFTSRIGGGAPGYTYSWSFGDGSPTSAAADPQHIYNTTGKFPVVLTVKDTGGHTAYAYTNITTTTVVLGVTASATPSTGAVPLPVLFGETVSKGVGPYLYDWSYGDGTPASHAAAPTHQYNRTGDFQANVTVTDSLGHTGMGSVTVSVLASLSLAATSLATPTSGTAPLDVSFNGSATGGDAPYTWYWNFGDGTHATVENPTHTFEAAGSYSVVLTVNDSASHSALATAIPITVGSSTVATTIAGPTSIVLGTPANFWANATGGSAPYTYAWSFGDQTSSTLEDPSHTYAAVGEYTVSVTATDAHGTISPAATMTVGVTSTSPLSVSLSGPSTGVVGTAVTFTATASGGAGGYSYSWSLGDSTVSSTGTAASISHTYGSAATFDVTVSVTDAVGKVATSTVHVITISSAPTTSTSPNPLIANGGLSVYGWAVLALVIVIVVVVVALARRRSKAPPSAESGGSGMTEWASPGTAASEGGAGPYASEAPPEPDASSPPPGA